MGELPDIKSSFLISIYCIYFFLEDYRALKMKYYNCHSMYVKPAFYKMFYLKIVLSNHLNKKISTNDLSPYVHL